MFQPSIRASIWSKLIRVLLLGAMFFTLYGASNWLTRQLYTTVPSYFFQWEKSIPFLPWTIVPYMLMDVMFVIGFLVCRNIIELNQLSKRVAFAIIISVTVFLLFPLEYAFIKPYDTGIFKPVFDLLKLDMPFNQCPSLHIALGIIFWHVFHHRFTALPARIVNAAWFLLIGLSTLTTYQHHFIDLPGGMLVGLMSLYFFPDKTHVNVIRYQRSSNMYALAMRYFLIAAPFWFIAVYLGSYAWVLAYPAVSFSLVGLAYLSNNNDFTNKIKGRFPPITILFLEPYFIIAKAVWQHLSGKDAPIVQIDDEIFMGRRLKPSETHLLEQNNIGAVLDLAPESSDRTLKDGMHYHYLPILDFAKPTPQWLTAASQWIQQMVFQRKQIFVHCTLGYYRSAAAVGAYLVSCNNMEIDQVIEKLQAVRPKVLDKRIRPLLQEFKEYHRGSYTMVNWR